MCGMAFTDFRMGRPAFEGTAHQRSDGLHSGRLSRHPRLWKGLGAEAVLPASASQ